MSNFSDRYQTPSDELAQKLAELDRLKTRTPISTDVTVHDLNNGNGHAEVLYAEKITEEPTDDIPAIETGSPAKPAEASDEEAEAVIDPLSQHKAFVYSLFEPTDTVCFLALPSKQHNFILAQDAVKPEFYDRLKALNETQSIYIAMGAYKPELIGQPVGRTKENVVARRNLYVEADENGLERKNTILSSPLVPEPTIVMESSPDKFHFIWRTDEEMTQDTLEGLLRGLASTFDTDSSVAEAARVLRVPGFRNRKPKYPDAPEVRLISITPGKYQTSQFKVAIADTPRTSAPATVNGDGIRNIPYGSHDVFLTHEAGKFRKEGLGEETLAAVLIELCEKRCIDYGKDDYISMCRKIAKSIAKHKPDPSGVAISPEMRAAAALAAAEPVTWESCFKGVGELDQGPVQLLIEGFMQAGVTFIGALPGEGKSWLLLSIARALTSGQPFLGQPDFKVPNVIPVLYLGPETSGRAFRIRCEKFGITKDRGLFLCRTISEGATLGLDNPKILEAVRKMRPVVIADTLIRFSTSNDENSSAQNKKLADDIVGICTAGAVGFLGAHHSTKAMRKKEGMSLETALRGTGDIAALPDCVYGLLRDDKLFDDGNGPNEIEVKCVKPPRDFPQPLPFRIAASYRTSGTIIGPGLAPGIVSYIDTVGDLKVVRRKKAPVDPNPARPNEALSDAEVCAKARDIIARTYGQGRTINKTQLALMLALNRKVADRVLTGAPDNPWSCITGGKHNEVFFLPKGITVLHESPEAKAKAEEMKMRKAPEKAKAEEAE